MANNNMPNPNENYSPNGGYRADESLGGDFDRMTPQEEASFSNKRARRRLSKGFLQATKYLNSHLNSGEYIIYRAHLSWVPVFMNQVPFMLAGGLIGGIAWGITGSFLVGNNIQLIAFAIGLLCQCPQIYKNIVTDIVITNQGIHSKHGFIMVQDDQFTRHNYINDAEIDINSIWQRLFNYANVTITTIAGTDDIYEFQKLSKPHVFKQAVRQAQHTFGNGGTPFDNGRGGGMNHSGISYDRSQQNRGRGNNSRQNNYA